MYREKDVARERYFPYISIRFLILFLVQFLRLSHINAHSFFFAFCFSPGGSSPSFIQGPKSLREKRNKILSIAGGNEMQSTFRKVQAAALSRPIC